MSRMFVCLHGHRWETTCVALEESTCPKCGASGELADTDDEKTMPYEVRDELPPPPKKMDVVASTPASVEWPERAGRYHVQEEIARGGMGAVLRVLDPDIERTLAVKIMLPHMHRNAGAQKRFLKEAKITGQLQHPGIPPIHELGTLESGGLFFAMKLIEGLTLASLLNERSNSGQLLQPGGEKRAAFPTATDLPRFIGIFEQICQTLAFAHARGLIHRDLKPANIMVGEFGEVQVMDWGLAKQIKDQETGHGSQALENAMPTGDGQWVHAAQTKAGSVLGTLAFMAPEQARGEIGELDERCDVFALGGILCQILTGRATFSSANDPLRQAKDGDVADAFCRLDECDADAELVQLAKRCLAPNKEERPQHAGEVAESVGRYQAQVQERLQRAELERAAAQARAKEERRRRRVTVALAAAVLTLVVGSTGTFFWYWQVQARRSRQQAQMNQAARAALKQARDIQTALHKKLRQRGGVFTLLDDPARWRGFLNEIKAARKRAKSLQANIDAPTNFQIQKEIEALNKLIRQDEADMQFALHLEEIRLEKSRYIRGICEPTVTEPKYAKALAKLVVPTTKNVERIKKSPICEQLIAGLDDWSLLAWMSGKYQLHERLLRTVRLADPDRWRDRIRHPDTWKDPQALQELADKVLTTKQAMQQMSPQMLAQLGRVLHMRGGQAEVLLLKAQGRYPKDFWLNEGLGQVLAETKKPARAAEFFRAAVALRPDNWVVYNNLGYALIENKDTAGAIAAYRKAITFKPKFADTYISLGNCLRLQKDLQRAEDAYRNALQIDPESELACNNLGYVLYEQKKYQAATDAFHKAIALNPKYALPHQNLGDVRKELGDLPGTVAAYEKAIALDPKFAYYYLSLGNALRAQKNLPGAIAAYQKAISVQPKHALSYYHLGFAFHQEKRFEQALIELDKSINLAANNVDVHVLRGRVLWDLGDFLGAYSAYQRVLFLLPAKSQLRSRVQQQLQRCRDLLALEKRLPLVLSGKKTSANDRLALAELCCYLKRFRDAVNLYSGAFAEQPKFVQRPSNRYSAALAAVLAAAGKGKDAGKINTEDRSKLRDQGLRWLQMELQAQRKALQANRLLASEIQGKLRWWLRNPLTTSVREELELSALPVAEQNAWRQFWLEVKHLQKKAHESYTEEQRTGALHDKQREQSHTIKLSADKTYVIDMSSQHFNSLLRLQNTNGQRMTANYILNSRIIFTPQHDGRYRIIAGSFLQRGRGTYSITIQAFAATKDAK